MLISLTYNYSTSRCAHKLLEKIVEKKCEQAKIIDYGLSETGAVLKLANTPETRWLLQGELKAIKDGYVFKEMKGKNGNYRGYVNKDGKVEGVGIEIVNDGNKYSGEYYGGDLNGVIKAEFADGNICWGMFKDSEQNGYNTYQFKIGNTYTGQFKNGKRDGYGKYRWRDGETYRGQFNDNKREGYGLAKFANNDVYDGQWLKDQRSGEAVVTYFNTGTIQRELWENNKQVKVLEILKEKK